MLGLKTKTRLTLGPLMKEDSAAAAEEASFSVICWRAALRFAVILSAEISAKRFFVASAGRSIRAAKQAQNS